MLLLSQNLLKKSLNLPQILAPQKINKYGDKEPMEVIGYVHKIICVGMNLLNIITFIMIHGTIQNI